MTEPDPHSFVLSRRAWRDTGGWPTDAAPKPPVGATRRGLREPASTSPAVDSVMTTRRALLAPREELAEGASPANAVADTTRRTAAQHLAETPLRRSTAQSPSLEPAAAPSTYPPGVAMRRLAAATQPKSTPAQMSPLSTSHPLDELSTPVWDAVGRRPEPQPVRTQSPPRDVPVPAEELQDGAAWSPIWAAITRTPTSGASAEQPARSPDAGDSTALPGAPDTATAEIVRFVMPRHRAHANSGIPPIFRPPPLPVSAPFEPLLPADAPVRHARRRTRKPLRLGMASTAAAAAAVLVLGGSVGVTAAVTGMPVSTIARNVVVAVAAIESSTPAASPAPAPSRPAVAAPTQAPTPQPTPLPSAADPCTTAATVAALQAGDDAAVIAAMGGADALRAAVASAGAPCIDLGDPARVWVVVDKTRPLDPIDYAPASLAAPEGVRSLEGGELREDAVAAMSAMVSAAAQAGVGEIALLSAYRSYDTQVTSFGNQVSDRGAESAELVSARPGYSEHQSGLAADIVPCDGECGTLDDLAGSVQGQWVAAHAWEFGWIVRYEAGHTSVTGYSPEAWHLRYIGVELARAYHAGGWHTLEEFFALPAAPDYVD